MAQAAFVRGLALAFLIGAVGVGPLAAQENVKLYAVAGKYEDIKTDLTNAIVNQGLTIDFTGNINAMLTRTGADVGSTKPVYRRGVHHVLLGQAVARDDGGRSAQHGVLPLRHVRLRKREQAGEIVIGYRRPLGGASESSKAALVEIDALLDKIAREATE